MHVTIHGHCSMCGGTFEPASQLGGGRRCLDCGRSTFWNPKVAAEVALTDPDGLVLLCRRAVDPHKGRLDLPGGFVEVGETAEEALRREVDEEVGLRGDDLGGLAYVGSATNTYEFEGVVHPVLVLQFTGTFTGDPVAGDDADATVLKAHDHITPAELAWPRLHLPLIQAAVTPPGP